MSSPTSSAPTRVQQLNNFLHALDTSKGRSDAFKALNTSDRNHLVKVLTSNKSLKIQPNNIASIDWNKGKSLVIGPVQKLLQDANKSKPVLSTQFVAKKHLHQIIGSKQLMKNGELLSFLSSQDLRSLEGVCKKNGKSVAMHAQQARQIIQTYNLEPLIARYCHTEIHTDTHYLPALNELMSLAGKLNEIEQLERPTYQTLGQFFELVEAGNLLRISDFLRIHSNTYSSASTINDFLKGVGGSEKLFEIAENIRASLKQMDDEGPISNAFYENRGLTFVPKEVCQLKALKVLRLHNNRLISLPKEIGQLKTLEILVLENNQLTSLPKEIGQLKALTQLWLKNNRLTSLPKEIGQLKTLEILVLKNNRLTSLPKEIGHLESLETLVLQDNQLTSLPKEIGQLQALEEFNIANNLLPTLPKEIGQLKALKRLWLRYNQLTSLPKEIGQLQALQELDIGSLPLLTRLPKEFANLQALTSLRAGNKTPLEIFPKEICQLKALQELFLPASVFPSIPKEIGQLQALRTLAITLNPNLVHLPKEVGMLAALTSLIVASNHLSSLPKELGQIPGLKKTPSTEAPLNFNNNGIIDLPEELADYANQLQEQNQNVQKLTILNRLRDALKKGHDCKTIATLLDKMEQIIGKESRSNLHRELAQVCKKDPKLGKDSQKLGFGRQAFLDPKVDPKLKLRAIEQALNSKATTTPQKIVEAVQGKQPKQAVQKQTILNQLKEALQKGHDCKKIGILLDAMEKNHGKDSRSALHRELAQVCKKDPKWSKETQKLGFGRQAFLNPKVDPKLKLKAIEQVLAQKAV